MKLHDIRGIPVSNGSRASLERYERAVELTASYFVDPLAVINEALTEEPQFAAGHCLRAMLAVTSTEAGAMPMLRESVEAIEALGPRANEREQAHAAAGRAWLAGDYASAGRRYGDILIDYPRDLVALQAAHICDFALGQSTMLRDRVAQVLPDWTEGVPGRGYVLGMHAFGLEETGLYERAEATGRKALELNPRDPWAVHAVTHVMEMQGRQREGIDFLTSRRADWAPDNGFAFHNWWHLALYHLDLGEHQQVLDLYDSRIRPASSTVALEMVDASAMLWRLTLRGIDVGSRWQELAQSWSAALPPDGLYAFNDVHAVMALTGAGDWHGVEAVLDGLKRFAAGAGTNAMMSREVGLPLSRAIAAFGRGDYAATIDDLQAVRPHANRFGGSHAQRDIIHLTLIESALRAGKGRLARALAAERTDVKPSSPFNWRLTARALATLGLNDEARNALDAASVRAAA